MKPKFLSADVILAKPKNRKLLKSFYKKVWSNLKYWDGLCHNIYLDVHARTLFEVTDDSTQTLLSGNYINRIHCFQGVTADMAKPDYSWQDLDEFLEQVAKQIEYVLEAREKLK